MKYKKELKNAFKNVDLMEAVHKARKKSTLLMEEQGITTPHDTDRSNLFALRFMD